MDFRQGTCTKCKHSFRVKATSTAQKAKCPKCGGVVEIGEVQHAASPAAPAPAEKPSSGGASSRTPPRAKPHGRHEHKKQPSNVPKIVGGVVGVVVVVVILVVAMGGGDKGSAAHAGNAPQAAKANLDHVPDAARLAETTDEEWTDMTALATDYFKPPFDKKKERSGDLLIHRGKRAVPAILNALKRADISTPEGTNMGWKAQTLLLQSLCNGTNFGWIRDTRPEDVAYNHKVIERWLEAWKEAGGDSEKWTEISKRGANPATSASQ